MMVSSTRIHDVTSKKSTDLMSWSTFLSITPQLRTSLKCSLSITGTEMKQNKFMDVFFPVKKKSLEM